MPPQISVVMAAYNAEYYIRETIDSILNQTFQDFELIIIDDCSTDSTSAIVDNYSESRMIHLHNQQNMGPSFSRNRGLEIAQGDYIAIMDADDVSLPERFEKQIYYMKRHPEVGVLGTNISYIDAYSRCIRRALYKQAPEPEHVNWLLLWFSPLPHSTVMLRRTVLSGLDRHYDPEYQPAEDYELWTRLSHYTKLAVLKDICLYYRVHKDNLSHRYTDLQCHMHHSIMRRELKWLLGDSTSDSGIETLSDLILGQYGVAGDPVAAADILVNVYKQYERSLNSQAIKNKIRRGTIDYLGQLWWKHSHAYPLRSMKDISRIAFIGYTTVNAIVPRSIIKVMRLPIRYLGQLWNLLKSREIGKRRVS